MLMEPIRRRDAQATLVRALLSRLGPAELVSARTTPWSSATFDGARHMLLVRLVGDDAADRAERLAAELRDAEFELRDHFVADVAARVDRSGAETALELEVLTIEAC